MSYPLLREAMEDCTMLNKTTGVDEYGSDYTRWTAGTTFSAAIVFDTSMESRIGEAQGVTSLYTVTTSRAKVLEYHDVFRRESDGKIFRVTSDGDDKYTPQSTPLDMRQVTAEEFLPAGEVH